MSDITFTSIIMGMTGSVVARVFTTLGLGFISYEALNVLATNLKTSILASYHAINPAILDVLNLAGVGESLNIIIAAMITKASLMSMKRIGVLPNS